MSTLKALRDFCAAYPEDVFPTPLPEHQAKDAAAAHVMREMALPWMAKAADEIERLRALLREQVEYTNSCDLGPRCECPAHDDLWAMVAEDVLGEEGS